MNCAYHSATVAVHHCLSCDRPLCPACSHQVRGSVYCQDCLVRGAEWAAAVRNLHVPKDAAKRAALLAIVPGLGAVYNNQYFKALVHVVIFIALIAAEDQIHSSFGVGAFVFYIFMIMDSYRTAEELQRQRVQEGGLVHRRSTDVSSPVWGGLVMALGFLLTLANYTDLAERVRKLWPLVIILLGVFMVYRSLSGNKTGSGSSGSL